MRSLLVGRIAASLLTMLLGATAPTILGQAVTRNAPEADRPVPARVQLDDAGKTATALARLGIEIDRHHLIHDGWSHVYVRAAEQEKLRALGIRFELLPDDGPQKAQQARDRAGVNVQATRGSIPAQYHTYDTLTSDLAQIAADHPDIVRLSSVGQTVQGRELWMVKLTDNPDVEEDEPEFAYISSMHGDEVVGKEMLYHLLDYLTDNYGTDARVTDLVDSTEIWILPSMNPDGTEQGQRYNASFVDLNRDFPDQFDDPVNTTAGRAPETQAIMLWKRGRTIDLSANFHGGALVANYPFDSNPQGTSTLSPTPAPDHDTFVSLAQTYADNNLPMSQQNGGSFVNGITNGADWYVINGGMQDWGYVWYGGFEILLELSQSKWPSATLLPGYWNDNLESLLAYMERAHEGVRGVITDLDTGLPVAATIQVDANPFVDYTDPDVGDFHRPLPPGTFDLAISALGYQTQVVPVTVAAGPAAVVNVALTPSPVTLDVASTTVLDGAEGFLDPGETADLSVSLSNLGRTATDVSARLVTTGFDATVTQPWATYPDIPLGATAAPDGSMFEIEADATIPAGRRVGFAVEWTSTEGAGTDGPFFLDVGAPQTDVSASPDVPQTISTSANVTAISTLTIGAGSSVSNLNSIRVALDLSHTYVGDLTITLESPAGTEVVLHSNTGGSGDDIVGTYGVDLDPAEPLDAFLGEDTLGTWTLTIFDGFSADGGTLNAWSLDVEGRPADTATPELRFRTADHAGGGQAVLTWWEYPGLTAYRVYRSTDPSQAASFLDVTAADGDATDTTFVDATADAINYYLVTGVGPNGEGPKGHFGE